MTFLFSICYYFTKSLIDTCQNWPKDWFWLIFSWFRLIQGTIIIGVCIFYIVALITIMGYLVCSMITAISSWLILYFYLVPAFKAEYSFLLCHDCFKFYSIKFLDTIFVFRYLHEVCSPSLVHKNIKSSNILLDADLNPHLSDSGLAIFHQVTIFWTMLGLILNMAWIRFALLW